MPGRRDSEKLRELLLELEQRNDALKERLAQRTAELQCAHERLEREVAERQRLEKENLETSTQERQWFAQELHDSLCQQLSTLSFMTTSLLVRLAQHEDSSPEVVEQVQRIVKLADRSVREGRALARGLFPVELEAEGLVSALHSLAVRTADAYCIGCRVQCDDEVPLDDHLTATNLYRITQEALSNAIRHGHARRVTITLEVTDVLSLRIEDDGVGIGEKPVASGEGAGIGLRTMRRRARAIGATLDVCPGEEKGTVVECRLPLEENEMSLTSTSVAAST